MTLEEKIIELQSVTPPLTREEIMAEVEKFKASQPKVGVDKFAEESAKQEGVVEQTDATVTPEQTPDASESEDTVSQSDQPSLESVSKQVSDFGTKIKSKPVDKTKLINDYLQKEYKDIPKIGEVITANDYQYKYEADVDEEGNLNMQVLYKGPEDEEFINASEKARSNPKNIALQNAEASILSQLGFLPEEIQEQAVAMMQPQQTQPQDFDPSREGIQSFDDMLFYNYEEADRINDLEAADRNVYIAQDQVLKQREVFEDLLKDPDNKKLVEGKIAKKRADLESKIEKIGDSDPDKLKEYQDQLAELDTEQGILNVIGEGSIISSFDEALKEMLPDIQQEAAEAATIKPFDEETGLGVVDGVFDIQGNIKFRRNALGRTYEEQMSPVYFEDKELLEQKALYDQAKKIYAQKNNVDVEAVTLEQARPIVEELYTKKIYAQKEQELLEGYSKAMLEINSMAGGSNIGQLAFGFKNFKDIFGETDDEKRIKLEAAAKKLDATKDALVIDIATQDTAAKNLKALSLVNRTYLSEEEAEKARQELKIINIENQANYDIVQKKLDTLSEKQRTADQAELFNNLYSRNYGFLTQLAGNAATSTLDLFVNGITEYATRMGVTDLVISANPLLATANLNNKLSGLPTFGRIATDKFTGGVDDVVNYINNEMGLPTTVDDNETAMDWARWFGQSAGQQIPIYAVLFGTGGAGLPLIGMATAGSKFREMQKEIDLGTADYNIFQMYGMAHLVGASAVATEYVTQGMLNRLKFSYQNVPGFKESFSDSMKSFLTGAGRWAKDMGEEIPSEMLDNLIGNIGDRYILGKKDVNLFDGMKETAFSTLWTAGVFIRAPHIGKQLMAPFTSKQAFQVIGENTSRLKELNSVLSTNKNLSPEAINQIKNEINQLSVDNMKAMKIEFDRLDQMTDGEKKVLLENKAKEYEVKRDIKSILNDNSIDQKTKDTLIESKNKQLYNIGTSSANVLAKYVLEENKQKNMPKVEQDIETVKKFAGEDNVTVIDTETEFAERTGKPKDADAFIDPETGQIFINKSWAAKVGAVTAGNHELLHKIIRAKMSSDPAAAVQLVEDFKNILSDKELSIVQKRIDDNYRYVRDENGVIQKDSEGKPIENDISEYAEEYLTAYSDAIGKGEITWSDNLSESFLRLGKKLLNFLKGKGFDQIEFKTGRDVYNFIRDYQANIQKGKLTETGQKMLTESEQF